MTIRLRSVYYIYPHLSHLKGPVENLHMFKRGHPRVGRLQVEMLTTHVSIVSFLTGPLLFNSLQSYKEGAEAKEQTIAVTYITPRCFQGKRHHVEIREYLRFSFKFFCVSHLNHFSARPSPLCYFL